MFRSTLTGVRFRARNDQQGPVDSNFITTKEILRRTADGFAITMDIEKHQSSRAGQMVASPVLDAFMAVDITLHLDTAGTALSTTGFEKILPYIRSQTDSVSAASVAPLLDPSMLEQRQVDDWNGRLERLIALSLNFETRGYDRSKYFLPEGTPLDFFTSYRLVDTSRINDRLTLRVIIDSDSNPSELAETTGQDIAAVAAQFELADATVSAYKEMQVRSLSHVELLVDAATLMVRQEVSMRTIELHINDPQAGPQNMQIVDQRTVDYAYADWQ